MRYLAISRGKKTSFLFAIVIFNPSIPKPTGLSLSQRKGKKMTHNIMVGTKKLFSTSLYLNKNKLKP